MSNKSLFKLDKPRSKSILGQIAKQASAGVSLFPLDATKLDRTRINKEWKETSSAYELSQK